MAKLTQFQRQGKAKSDTVNHTVIARADGSLEIRDSFYYRMGRSSAGFAQARQAEIPGSRIRTHGEIDQAWPKLSYFYVILEPIEANQPAAQ